MLIFAELKWLRNRELFLWLVLSVSCPSTAYVICLAYIFSGGGRTWLVLEIAFGGSFGKWPLPCPECVFT